MHSLTFDIETVPDIALGRRLLSLDGLSDEDVARIMFHRQRQRTGSDFLPLTQQRVVAISAALRTADSFKVWTVGEVDADEAEILRRFFDGLERLSPDLVSWNGSGFDLPVLNYRALLHGIAAARYWEVGDHDRDFRYNNYLGRFHWRHMDLMDVLAGYQVRGRARLDEVALMLGFPGKLGMSGDQVWEQFQRGEIEVIRNYCETDVLNTYLVYLRFELMRGNLTSDEYARELDKTRSSLEAEQKPHLDEFLKAWHR